jgi:hypothetical protein
MFRRKDKLLRDLYLLSFDGYLRKYCGSFCLTTLTPQAALAFLVGSSVEVKGLNQCGFEERDGVTRSSVRECARMSNVIKKCALERECDHKTRNTSRREHHLLL